MGTLYATTPIQKVEVNGTPLAYRRFGKETGTPLVMFNRFRGSIDDWDPAVIQRLSAEREIIVFDYAGVGFSEGDVEEDITAMAVTGADFIRTIGLNRADLLGYSMGGYIVEKIALTQPELVRNLILVGTGAGAGEGAVLQSEEVEHWVKPEMDRSQTLQMLWFSTSPTGVAATEAYMDRIYTPERPAQADVTAEAGKKLRAAVNKWWAGHDSTLDEIHNIQSPTLIVNGIRDAMVPTENSFLMAQKIPNAQLIVYPDSGHGSLFQYPETFSNDVLRFLNAQEAGGIN